MGDDNKAVVRRFAQECWDRGRLDVADELVAQDVSRNGQPIGREGLIAIIATVRSALPDFHTDIEDMLAEHDKVAWRYSSGDLTQVLHCLAFRSPGETSIGQAPRSCGSKQAKSKRFGTTSICWRSTQSSARSQSQVPLLPAPELNLLSNRTSRHHARSVASSSRRSMTRRDGIIRPSLSDGLGCLAISKLPVDHVQQVAHQ